MIAPSRRSSPREPTPQRNPSSWLHRTGRLRSFRSHLAEPVRRAFVIPRSTNDILDPAIVRTRVNNVNANTMKAAPDLILCVRLEVFEPCHDNSRLHLA